MCDRSDVVDLLPADVYEKMRKAIEEDSLQTTILLLEKIEWKNDYLSAGLFQTDKKVSKGNLLCIRKEIYNDQCEIQFVWTCHAVVSAVSRENVEFLVCSLYQNGMFDQWKEENRSKYFVVEVIDVETYENSKIQGNDG